MLSFRTIVPDTLELLRRLTQEPFLKDCRLVGGTALALQYGHRSSIDLDFFGAFDIDGDDIYFCCNISRWKKYWISTPRNTRIIPYIAP